MLEKNGIIGSLSRKGFPCDNAPMESFFQTLKTEYILQKIFSDC
jgi:transposase InsO family protein